jgi:hypothetical protein
MSENKEMSEEDYLKKHLNSVENKTNTQSFYKSDIPDKKEPIIENAKVSDLHFFNFEVSQLPCGKFYPHGTLFMIRPALVKEIQAYAMVDDNNFYDIVEKMNGMLQSCVRLKYPDGKMGTFLDIKDQDRLFIIFMIRELTFQQGNSLTITVPCQSCGTENSVELKRQHFVFHDEDEKLKKFYSPNTGTYNFSLKNGTSYEVTPPNIGLQKSFTDYIVKENNEKRTPNMAFLKIIPFLMPGKSSITYDGIKAKLREFETMDDISFQFLNAAINKMTFGIKELSKVCQCGEEVRAEMQFPNGASGIFVIHDAFEAYIKE